MEYFAKSSLEHLPEASGYIYDSEYKFLMGGMYVHACICMRICVYVYMYMLAGVYMHAYVCVIVYVCIYVYAYLVCVCTWNMCIYVQESMHVCKWVCVCLSPCLSVSVSVSVCISVSMSKCIWGIRHGYMQTNLACLHLTRCIWCIRLSICIWALYVHILQPCYILL